VWHIETGPFIKDVRSKGGGGCEPIWTTVVTGGGGVGHKQDVHFCRTGNTILTIKDLQKKYAKRSNRKICRFGVSDVLHIFTHDTIRISVDEGVGEGSSKQTKLDKGGGGGVKKVSFGSDVFDE